MNGCVKMAAPGQGYCSRDHAPLSRISDKSGRPTLSAQMAKFSLKECGDPSRRVSEEEGREPPENVKDIKTTRFSALKGFLKENPTAIETLKSLQKEGVISGEQNPNQRSQNTPESERICSPAKSSNKKNISWLVVNSHFSIVFFLDQGKR